MGKFEITPRIAVDTETTGIMPWHGDRAFAVVLFNQEGQHWYTEWPVDPFTREVSPDIEDLWFLERVFKNPLVDFFEFHNSKFDIRMLSYWSLFIQFDKVFDILFAARVCNTLEPSFRLKALGKKYAGIDDGDEKELQQSVNRARRVGRKLGWLLHESPNADYWTPRIADPQDTVCETYTLYDGLRTRVLADMYSEILAGDEDFQRTYAREIQLQPHVYRMEERGTAIYPQRNRHELNRSKRAMKHALEELRKMTGDDTFNPDSPKQLAKVLYSPKDEGGFGLEPKLTTKTGQPSTAHKAVRAYSSHPFVRQLLGYRAPKKAISTFFNKYRLLMVPDDVVPGGYCVHPWFNQNGARTLRFSCTNPNLQQVADSRGFGQVQARGPFGPRPDHVMWLFDYSQQEGRIFAEVSGIQELIDMYLHGIDVNTEIANRCWGGKGNPYALQAAAYTLELGSEEPQNEGITEVWKEIGWSREMCKHGVTSAIAHKYAQRWLAEFAYDIVKADKSVGTTRSRTRAKIILFCKIFGGGAAAIQDLLYCTLAEAKQQMARFDSQMPGIQAFINAAASEARSNGYVYNQYGDKLMIDPNFAYRACNYRVQGTAAAMMKQSIIKCSRYIDEVRLRAFPLMTVHDEFSLEVWMRHAHKWFAHGIKTRMEDTDGAMKKIPMIVEAKFATERWDKKEELKFDEPGVKIPVDSFPTVAYIRDHINKKFRDVPDETIRSEIIKAGLVG